MKLLRIATLFLVTTATVCSLQFATAQGDSPGTPTNLEETPHAGENVVELMLTQHYIDMSEEAISSDTLPEIVLITVMKLTSEEAASLHFDEFTGGWDFESTFTITEFDDIADEAVFVESVDEGGDHGAWMVARSKNVVITAFVTGAPEAPEIAQDIVRYIVEHGPSDAKLMIADDTTVTGGWADAFPLPNDIEGLSHFDPNPVTYMNTSDDAYPQSTPIT